MANHRTTKRFNILLVSVLLTTVISAQENRAYTCSSTQYRSILERVVNTCEILHAESADLGSNIEIPAKNIEGFIVRNQPAFKQLPENLFEAIPNLVVIEVFKCGLENITQNDLKKLRKLRELDLSHNKIKSIQEGSFDDLSELQWLYLQNNEISYLDKNMFVSLTKLNVLHLATNHLSKFNSKLFNYLTSLEILNLSENGIQAIDQNAFKGLGQLTDIDLSYNKLVFLGEEIFQNNSKLENILLNVNELMYISPKILERKPELKWITFENNNCINSAYSDNSFDELTKDLEKSCSIMIPSEATQHHLSWTTFVLIGFAISMAVNERNRNV